MKHCKKNCFLQIQHDGITLILYLEKQKKLEYVLHPYVYFFSPTSITNAFANFTTTLSIGTDSLFSFYI
jgi:hypothetical protein